MSPVQTSNIALLKRNIWSPDSGGHFSEMHIMMELDGFKTEGQRGDAAKQEKLLSLTGETLTSRAGTHFCILDFVLYGSRQAHETSIRGYLKSTAFFLAELGLIDMVPKNPGICEK